MSDGFEQETDSGETRQTFEAGLYADGVRFGADDATLLRAIDRVGSISGAAEAVGRSYPRAHERLGELERAFGPLVDAVRGGTGGGGTELTESARSLLARFERLQTEFSGVTNVEETVYEGTVVDRDGEIATVRTPVGELYALAPTEADEVQVTIRADTVTIHKPSGTSGPNASSARNQFTGPVVELDERESVVYVGIDSGADQPLSALITAPSAARLDLAVGTAVVVSFKTTATRATPRD